MNRLLSLALISFFILETSDCFSQESNLEAIKNITIKGDKELIEQDLIGNWKFVKLEYQDSSDRNLVPDEWRPDIVFTSDHKYEILSEINYETGTWLYDNIEGYLELTYDEPKWSLPVDKMSDELISLMKDQGLLKKVKGDSWIINDLSNSELRVVEFLPMNETELNYVIQLYRKQ